MADDPNPNGEGGGGDHTGAGDGGGTTLTQEQVNALVGKARVEARTAFLRKIGVESEEELATMLKEAGELRKAQMTEVERVQAERDEALRAAEEARAEAEAAKLQVLRSRIGREKGLPEPLIARLTGTDEEGITAEVEELLPFVKGTQDDDLGGGTRPPGGDGGSGKTPDEKMAAAMLKALGRT